MKHNLKNRPETWTQYLLARDGETGDYPDVTDLILDLFDWFQGFEAELSQKCDSCHFRNTKTFCEPLCHNKLTPKQILGIEKINMAKIKV